MTKLNRAAIAESLDRTPSPLYLQVAALLRQRIEKGEWLLGQRLPSIEVLATNIPVAKLTIRQAIRELETEGLVICKHGSGTFVAKDVSNQRWYRVATDWKSLIDEISEGTQKTLQVQTPTSDPELIEGNGRLAQSYRFFKRLNLKDGLPYGFMSYHIATNVFERDSEAFISGPVLPTLGRLKQVQIASAKQTMSVATADPEASTLLQIPLNVPIVRAHRVVLDAEGVAIFVSQLTYRGDYVRFEIDLMPPVLNRSRKPSGRKGK